MGRGGERVGYADAVKLKAARAVAIRPAGRPFTVRLGANAGPKARAWWFNPRTGTAAEAGTFETAADHRFTPPEPGEALDWVLVLDDAAKGYGPPGRIAPARIAPARD